DTEEGGLDAEEGDDLCAEADSLDAQEGDDLCAQADSLDAEEGDDGGEKGDDVRPQALDLDSEANRHIGAEAHDGRAEKALTDGRASRPGRSRAARRAGSRSVKLVEVLAGTTIGGTYNQYACSPLLRERLRRYLAGRADAELLLAGEAAGYRGARVSGIPFTSERQLTGTGPAEASATIVPRRARRSRRQGEHAPLERRADPSRHADL